MPEHAPLRCRKCGSNKFAVPDHATNDSLVTCSRCGAGIGRWGDVRVGILDEAKQEKKRTQRQTSPCCRLTVSTQMRVAAKAASDTAFSVLRNNST